MPEARPGSGRNSSLPPAASRDHAQVFQNRAECVAEVCRRPRTRSPAARLRAMPTGVHLRPARPDDAPFLLALRAHPAVAPFMGRRDQDQDALRAELAAADDVEAGRLVIHEGDTPAGALAWR